MLYLPISGALASRIIAYTNYRPIFHSITTVWYTMNTIKTVLTTIILALFLANCVQLLFIVNCKTVGQNKNIKENNEAPDKSWSVTIANQDTTSRASPQHP